MGVSDEVSVNVLLGRDCVALGDGELDHILRGHVSYTRKALLQGSGGFNFGFRGKYVDGPVGIRRPQDTGASFGKSNR